MGRLRGEIDYEEVARREAVENTESLRQSGYPSAVTAETYRTQLTARRKYHRVVPPAPKKAHNS